MGYTHYWTFSKLRNLNKKHYDAATLTIAGLVYGFSKRHGGIAGYSAHVKPGVYAGVEFNGSRENGYEPFILRQSVMDAKEEGTFFCKTNGKPYDVLVTAALCILYDMLGDERVTVQSDGRYPEWVAGAELASSYMKRRIAVPPAIKRISRLKRVA